MAQVHQALNTLPRLRIRPKLPKVKFTRTTLIFRTLCKLRIYLKKLPKVKSTRAALAAHTTKLPKSEIYQKPVAFEYLWVFPGAPVAQTIFR